MKMMTSVSDLVDDYDWKEAFANAKGSIQSIDSAPITTFSISDVVKIISIENGENDGDPWIGVFELADSRFVFVAAGCDYTGWD